MTTCKRSSPWSLTEGRLCLLRLIPVWGSNIQHPQWRLPEAGQQRSSKGWGQQGWGARWERKAGRLGLEPLLRGVSWDCSDSLPCHIITQRWEQPWVCPGLEPLLLKHFWIADEFMLMRRLQITVNIKSSSGTPGVNISQRLPTSLCFSFASYKAIKQGRKKPNKTTKKPISCYWKNSPVLAAAGAQEYITTLQTGQSLWSERLLLFSISAPISHANIAVDPHSSMLTTIRTFLIFTIILDCLCSVFSLETPPRRRWVCVMSHA